MIRFTIKFTFIITLLLFGMLIGMNMAEKGIYEVTGTNEPPKSFQIVKQDNQVDVMVLGKTYSSELPDNLTGDNGQENSEQVNNSQTDSGQTENDQSGKAPNSEKQLPNQNEQPVVKNNVNFMSNLGNKLGELFQIGAEKGLNLIAKLIE